MKGRLKPFTPEENKSIKFLYARRRLSTYAIAEMIGRHQTGVRKALVRLGVKMRSMSEAAQIPECQGVKTFRVCKIEPRRGSVIRLMPGRSFHR